MSSDLHTGISTHSPPIAHISVHSCVHLRVREDIVLFARVGTYDLAAGLRMAVNKQKDMDLREMEQDRQKARSNPFLQIETEKANLKRSKNVDQFGAFTKPVSKVA